MSSVEELRKIDSVAKGTRLYYYDDNRQVMCGYDGSINFKRAFVYGNYIGHIQLMTDSSDNDYYYVYYHLYNPVALTGR